MTRLDRLMGLLGVDDEVVAALARWQRWRWRRTHRPFDWELRCPEMNGPPEHHIVRRVWPDPDPAPPERIIVVETIDESVWFVNHPLPAMGPGAEGDVGDDFFNMRLDPARPLFEEIDGPERDGT